MPGKNEVRKVDKEAGKLTIKHGPLDGDTSPRLAFGLFLRLRLDDYREPESMKRATLE